MLGAYALGLVLALLFYLQVFASPFSGNAGQVANRGSSTGKRAQATVVEYDLTGEPAGEALAI